MVIIMCWKNKHKYMLFACCVLKAALVERQGEVLPPSRVFLSVQQWLCPISKAVITGVVYLVFRPVQLQAQM